MYTAFSTLEKTLDRNMMHRVGKNTQSWKTTKAINELNRFQISRKLKCIHLEEKH